MNKVERLTVSEAAGVTDGGLRAMLDATRARVMLCDKDLILVYVNPAAMQALRSIEADLRKEFNLGADELVGRSIHTFHRNPAAVERILRDPRALPHTGHFLIGGAALSTTVSAVHDHSGAVAGFVVNWEDETTWARAVTNLEGSLSERETLLRELHHRVKNNLQLVASLLRLESERTPAASGALEECALRVEAMCAVHERLYDGRELSRLDLAGYLRELVEALSVGRAKEGIVVEFQGNAAVSVTVDAAVPLGLSVVELATNALKHAFNGRGGRLTVALSTAEGGETCVAVEDDGVGMDGSPATERSMGLRLVRQMIERQLKGRLVRGPSARGTRWEIRFRSAGE